MDKKKRRKITINNQQRYATASWLLCGATHYGNARGAQRGKHESLDIDSKSFTQKQEVGHIDRMDGI